MTVWTGHHHALTTEDTRSCEECDGRDGRAWGCGRRGEVRGTAPLPLLSTYLFSILLHFERDKEDQHNRHSQRNSLCSKHLWSDGCGRDMHRPSPTVTGHKPNTLFIEEIIMAVTLANAVCK